MQLNFMFIRNESCIFFHEYITCSSLSFYILRHHNFFNLEVFRKFLSLHLSTDLIFFLSNL